MARFLHCLHRMEIPERLLDGLEETQERRLIDRCLHLRNFQRTLSDIFLQDFSRAAKRVLFKSL